jgi:hypothetical protein
MPHQIKTVFASDLGADSEENLFTMEVGVFGVAIEFQE